MGNIEASVSSASRLSKEVGDVPFQVAVRESSGFVVIPFDATDEMDKDLIRILNNTLNKFLKTLTNTKSRLQGNRVNEVGRRIEELLVNELNKQPLNVKKLGSSGYPDVEISHRGRTIYLEMKTSTLDENSSFRYFYFTNGKKIKCNAKHLLLDIKVSEESPHYWKVEKWALSDLSRLKLRLKCEFNASKSDLLDREARLLVSQ
ncbi:MAG: hypothetical protein M3115_05525 [Thermoproteota archaeon]|nr:hypothetical protein [Thermoproteota archaeon]